MKEKDEYERKIDLLNNKIDKELEQIDKLKENKEVKKYINLLKELRKNVTSRNNLYEDLYKKMAEDCDHPAWYYIRSEKYPQATERILKCSCIKCGKEKIAKLSYFYERLIGLDRPSLSYEDVREKYQKFKEEHKDNETIKKFVKSFYE